MRTLIGLGIASAALLPFALNALKTPATAQVARENVGRSDLKDITESLADKSLKIEAGLKEGEELNYAFGFHGESLVVNDGVAATSKTTTSVVLNLTTKKPGGDDPLLEVEAKYTLLSILHDQAAEGQTKGKSLSLVVRTDVQEGNGLWIDGIEQDSPPKGLPGASTVRSNMMQPCAYCRLGKGHQDLSRPAHAARFTDAIDEAVPQRLLDPVLMMRTLFAGWGGREFKLGESFSFDSTLSTDTAGSYPVAYTVSLKATKAWGKEAEAEIVGFEMTATPKAGARLEIEGVSVPAMELKGDVQIELKRGLVVKLGLSGEMNSGSGDTKASGELRITADLITKRG